MVLNVNGGAGVEVTVGSDKEGEKWPYAGTAGGIETMGAKHVVKKVGLKAVALSSEAPR